MISHSLDDGTVGGKSLAGRTCKQTASNNFIQEYPPYGIYTIKPRLNLLFSSEGYRPSSFLFFFLFSLEEKQMISQKNCRPSLSWDLYLCWQCLAPRGRSSQDNGKLVIDYQYSRERSILYSFTLLQLSHVLSPVVEVWQQRIVLYCESVTFIAIMIPAVGKDAIARVSQLGGRCAA